MSNLAYGPKVRNLTKDENISSLEAWQSTITYGLRLNPDFREFLKSGFIWGKKSSENPTIQLEDIYTKETITEGTDVKEVLVKTQTKEERAETVDLLLNQIANFCTNIP